jgi:hypothetical protein
MECACGGSTIGASYERKKSKITLEVARCRSCGREGKEMLYENDLLTLQGTQARQRFNSFDTKETPA